MPVAQLQLHSKVSTPLLQALVCSLKFMLEWIELNTNRSHTVAGQPSSSSWYYGHMQSCAQACNANAQYQLPSVGDASRLDCIVVFLLAHKRAASRHALRRKAGPCHASDTQNMLLLATWVLCEMRVHSVCTSWLKVLNMWFVPKTTCTLNAEFSLFEESERLHVCDLQKCSWR